MNLSTHPVIVSLAEIDESWMHFFSPVEQAVIEVCKQIVEEYAT